MAETKPSISSRERRSVTATTSTSSPACGIGTPGEEPSFDQSVAYLGGRPGQAQRELLEERGTRERQATPRGAR